MEIIEYKQEMETDVQAYVSALPKTIENNETFLIFSSELKINKAKQKAIDERLEPEKKKARAAWQSWVDLIDELKSPLIKMEQHYKAEIARYSAEQEKIRKAEEARLQEIARKEEEERQLAAAIAAEQSGDKEEAAAIIEAPVYVPPVVVPRAVPKVAGVSMTKLWRYRIVDETKVPRQYLCVDEQKIGAVVRAMKDQASIPGVEVFAIDSVSSRAA